MLARDVMTRDVTTIPVDTSIEKMIKLIKAKNYSGLPVVDGSGKAVGVVSQNDILRGLAYISSSGKLGKAFQTGKRKASLVLLKKGKGAALSKFLKTPVQEVMTPSIEACGPETPVADVCQKMVARRIHRVIVIEGGKVAGLISATDLVRAFGVQLKRVHQ